MSAPGVDVSRLGMPLHEAIFTQRAIRRFKPDPIPMADLRLIIEAAVRAPNGGNQQVGRFLVLTDRAIIREFGTLYREAWWAKRWDDHKWTKPEDIPPDNKNHRARMGLAAAMKDAPCVVLAFSTGSGGANSVIPSVQNLMLAARALGIGSRPTTLHAPGVGRADRTAGAPRKVDGPRERPARHPQGRDVPVLRAARLSAGRVRPQQPQAHLGDHVPQPLERRGALEVATGVTRASLRSPTGGPPGAARRVSPGRGRRSPRG